MTQGAESMTSSQKLEIRVNEIVSSWENTDAKRIFGGTCHLVNGNMFCGIHEHFLILRIGEASAQKAFELPNVKPFDITGRAMKGWIMVASKELKLDADLKKWLVQAKRFARLNYLLNNLHYRVSTPQRPGL